MDKTIKEFTKNQINEIKSWAGPDVHGYFFREKEDPRYLPDDYRENVWCYDYFDKRSTHDWEFINERVDSWRKTYKYYGLEQWVWTQDRTELVFLRRWENKLYECKRCKLCKEAK